MAYPAPPPRQLQLNSSGYMYNSAEHNTVVAAGFGVDFSPCELPDLSSIDDSEVNSQMESTKV